MRPRSLGVTTLAFSSVMVGLYCQFATIALILTGSVFVVAGSRHADLALFTGTVFLGLTVAAYFLGYGLWTRRHWSWAGAIALFLVFVGANVVLSVVSGNVLNTLVPALGAIVGIWYLHRPAIKAELLGEKSAIGMTAPTSDARGAAQLVR